MAPGALLLAVLLAGCGGGSLGAGALPPVENGDDARFMVETVAEVARVAAGNIASDGAVVNHTVRGERGTASVTGEVFHTTTPTFAGGSPAATLDVDVTVVFDDFRVGLGSGLSATVTGTVDLLDTFPSPGSAIDPLNVLPQPIEVSGDVSAAYEGSDVAGRSGQADTFVFDAAGRARDELRGALTNRAGTTFRF